MNDQATVLRERFGLLYERYALRLKKGAPGDRGEPVIYFLHSEATDQIKIGHSTHFNARWTQYRTHNPELLDILVVAPGSRGEEQLLHRLFREHRARGEWYTASDELWDWVLPFFRLDMDQLRSEFGP